MKRKIMILLASAFLLLLGASFVSACSCIRPAPPLESLESATAVFSGKVTGIDVPGGLIKSSMDPVKVTFDVGEVWKGDIPSSVKIMTARDGASCGYYFVEGEEYIVYAGGEDDDLRVSICSRTSLLSSAQEDIEELGVGIPPSHVSQDSDRMKDVYYITAIVLLLIIIGILFFRKK